jgi:hypothetical protein
MNATYFSFELIIFIKRLECSSNSNFMVLQRYPLKINLPKCVEVNCFYIWSILHDKVINLQYMPLKIQLADEPNIIFSFSISMSLNHLDFAGEVLERYMHP